MSLVTSRITTSLPAACYWTSANIHGQNFPLDSGALPGDPDERFSESAVLQDDLNGLTPCSGIQQFNNLISETRKVRGTRSSLQKDYANSTKPAKSALFAPPYEFRYINMDRSSSKGTLSFALLNLKVSKTKRLGYFVSSNLAPEEARLLL